jgi:hypothetical protein
VKCEEGKNEEKGVEWRERRGKGEGAAKKRLTSNIAYRIHDFAEQHSRGIYNPQPLNGRDGLGEDPRLPGGGDVFGFWRVKRLVKMCHRWKMEDSREKGGGENDWDGKGRTLCGGP